MTLKEEASLKVIDPEDIKEILTDNSPFYLYTVLTVNILHIFFTLLGEFYGNWFLAFLTIRGEILEEQKKPSRPEHQLGILPRHELCSNISVPSRIRVAKIFDHHDRCWSSNFTLEMQKSHKFWKEAWWKVPLLENKKWRIVRGDYSPDWKKIN